MLFYIAFSVALPSWPFRTIENIQQMISGKLPFSLCWRCGLWKSVWLMGVSFYMIQ